MKFPSRQPRDYVWGWTGKDIIVRSARPRDGFQPVVCPKSGYIRFEFEAAPRTGTAKNRQPMPWECLRSWATQRLSESGIKVLDLEIDPFVTHISSLPSRIPEQQDGRTLVGAFMTGIGKVTGPKNLAVAWQHGIRGSGPKCWGFGTLVIE